MIEVRVATFADLSVVLETPSEATAAEFTLGSAFLSLAECDRAVYGHDEDTPLFVLGAKREPYGATMFLLTTEAFFASLTPTIFLRKFLDEAQATWPVVTCYHRAATPEVHRWFRALGATSPAPDYFMRVAHG